MDVIYIDEKEEWTHDCALGHPGQNFGGIGEGTI